jgi:2-amino-4-hydroxy-6-hydroxymethyldihydropteridine diphosphokinase
MAALGTELALGYVGLGSNLGDRLAKLRAARDGLIERGVAVTRSSSVYEAEPMEGALGQSDFLNACLQVKTELGPERLLEVCKAIEADLGRVHEGAPHAPRPIDLDLLLLGEERRDDGRLSLPHPHILRRRFVLLPLLELDPDLELPLGSPLADRLDAVSDQRVDLVGTALGDTGRR